jgi:transcriptional regulator with XRE-family HTH domain
MGKRRDKAPDLAEQLRQAIRGCGMSLNRLAEATGVHKAQLSRFLRSEQSLTLKAAAKLCNYLGLRLAGPALDPKE